MYRSEQTVNYLIRVRDTGKGMDPRYISRIFLPFEQEDRTIARRYGGTGLGMAITDALVDLMGGTIVVDTEPGKGSDFTANIPFKLADDKQIEQLEQEGETLETRSDESGTPTEYKFAGKRFLLIDDIVTTGATLAECVRVLKAAGAADVVCLTLAMARDH